MLPIPEILKNAADVIRYAKAVEDGIKLSETRPAVRKALAKVSPEDVHAALNEIGRVYMGIHNIQVLQFGAKANPETKLFEVVLQIEYGLGPVFLTIPMPAEMGQRIIDTFLAEMAKMQPTKLLTNTALISNG